MSLPQLERYEIIEGTIYAKESPSQTHQHVSSNLHRDIASFLKGKTCKVFHAPFDVCLNSEGDKGDTIVQPDLLVVSDKSKLDGIRCNGAPDLVIEILSPKTARMDTLTKFQKYLKAGVREYWRVDLENKILTVHILEENKYYTNVYADTDVVPVHVLNKCKINLKDIFTEG